MIGVTIGIGEAWEALAQRTAKRMQSMTGLRCHVINADHFQCAHPSWLKCHVHKIFPDQDSYFIFDSDILPLREWNPRQIFQDMRRPFIGVPEPSFNPDLKEECKKRNLPFPDLYLNGGLLIYGQEHTWIWEKVWNYHPLGGSWMEQTALNEVLIGEHIEIMRLPRHFNLLAHKGRLKSIYARSTLKDAVNVHTCSLKDPAAITQVHDKILAYYRTGEAGKTRDDLLSDLRDKFGYGTSHGAELGVFEGAFSKRIQTAIAPDTFHLVDLFKGRVISGDENGQNIRSADMDIVRRKLIQEIPTAQIHAADSVQWLLAQPIHSLDWVYLDTSHEYEQTCHELEAARHAVRPGGVIAGHDFSQAFPEVIQAVREFINHHDLPLKIYDGNLLPSFWIDQ